MAQDIRGNREAFVRIGHNTCKLVHAVLQECMAAVDKRGSVSHQTQMNIADLAKNLQEIEVCVLRIQQRGLLSRWLNYGKDKEEVEWCEDRLRYACELFRLRADMAILEDVQYLLQARRAANGEE
ncbi:unnamed protein product [Cyclocybe aegerita]|uniref:Uncharacterized protein n=1 Tax=Cyclocybe aegerita TaxID=1973307 RepID=A0A8S0WJ68_CYCAE|nr:unnamed protein product [Cyclocybe aegerita]